MNRQQKKRVDSRKRGNARMKEFGYRLVQVWLDPSEAKLIEQAARLEGKPLASYLRKHAVDRATRDLLGTTAKPML